MSQYLALPVNIDNVANTATICGDEAHHLSRVARVRVGEKIALFTGRGSRYAGAVSRIDRDTVEVSGLTPLPANEPPHPVTLAAALIKAERWEWLIEKAVELGATEIRPLLCERSEAREADKKFARWEKIILAAAKQCERGLVPVIIRPSNVAEFVSGLAPNTDFERRYVLCERVDACRPEPADGPLILAAGPEGSFTDAEKTELFAAGFTPATLGARILRSETACAAALALTAQTKK